MSVSHYSRATRGRFDRGWWSKPEVYVPLIGVGLLLIAGLIYFVYLTTTLSAEASTFNLSKLEQMESASVIVDRNDQIFGQIYVENRQTIPYDQLPRDLVNAVVAIEDNKFYQHNGYDLGGIVRAALKNFTAGHVRQGASTVTQQLARNSFALKERTFKRKLLEIFLSRRIEERFGKQKIMELYLNRIYFGGGLYGSEAAARGYFGKSAKEMTLAESATLAGLIKSPNKLSPWGDRAASKEARNVVLGRMRDLGFITAEKCASAQNEEVPNGNRQTAQGQTYAVDYVRQQVIAAVGWDRAMNEGFRIHTTIDAEMQKVAEESLRTHLDQAEQHAGYSHPTYAEYATRFKNAKKIAMPNPAVAPDYLQGAVIALDNASGGILALVGGRDFEHNQFDRALQARLPAGTAMKPFVYAAGFEKGMFPGTVAEDAALDNRAVMIGGTTGILGEWGPEREDNRYEGPITAREALSKSKNAATIRFGMNVGVDAVVQLCKTAGIRSPLRQYPSTFLGSSEITLAELTLAYTIFPNGGSRPDAPHILDRIEEKDGSVVWQAPAAKARQTVIKPETAYEVHSCLVDALQTGTGRAARQSYGLKDFPAAGKTGTAYDFTDAIFSGYDSAVTCAVWAGFDKPQKIYRGAFGSEIALPVWVDIMNASSTRYVPKEQARPAGLHDVEICSRSGLLATDKCFEIVNGEPRRTTYRELATDSQMPTEPCNVHGEVRAQLVRDLPASGVPRAALAADLTQASPVSVKGPTLLAENDPYGSVKSTMKPKPVPEKPKPETPAPVTPVAIASPAPDASTTPEDAMPDPSKPVLRAQPAQRETTATVAPSAVQRARAAQTNESTGRNDPFRPRSTQSEIVRPSETPVEIRRAQAVRPSTSATSDPTRERILRVPTPTPTPADLDEDRQ